MKTGGGNGFGGDKILLINEMDSQDLFVVTRREN
jgi:hypothetical protein